jgi:putative copper export protein
MILHVRRVLCCLFLLLVMSVVGIQGALAGNESPSTSLAVPPAIARDRANVRVDGEITPTSRSSAADVNIQYARLVQQVERSTRALQPPPVGDALIRWFLIVSLTLLAGGFAFAPLVLSAGGLADFRQVLAPTRRRILGISILLTSVASLISVVTSVAQNSVPQLTLQPGLILLLRLILLVVLAVMLRVGRDESLWVLLPASLLLLMQSLVSHGASEPQPVAPVLADWVHFIFTSLWLGGVAMLAMVVAPAALAAPNRLRELGIAITRFSPLAMFSVFAIALTGIAQSAGFVGSFEALFNTAYGRAILVKVALLLLLIAFGAFHQQVISPRLQAWRLRDVIGSGAMDAARRFRVSILAEMGVSLLLLAAVGVLTALPLARDVAVDPAVTVLTQLADDLTLTLGITSVSTGAVLFDLHISMLASGSTVDARQVMLQIMNLTDGAGGTELPLQRFDEANYVGQYAGVKPNEAWRIEAVVRRTGKPDTRATFITDAQ